MSRPEFEQYLERLTRRLRLGSRRNDEIRRELRAHVADALEHESTSSAEKSRNQNDEQHVITRVLAEFGPVEVLARRFRKTHLTRRWIMHGSLTAAVAGIAAVALFTLLPGQGPAIAEGESMPSAADHAKTTEAAARLPEYSLTRMLSRQAQEIAREQNAELLDALGKRVPEVEFVQVPFGTVVDWLEEYTGVNVFVDWSALGDYDINGSREISLRLHDVSLERTLQLILSQLTDDVTVIDYRIEGGILVITPYASRTWLHEVVIYDVSDLLQTTSIDRLVELTQRMIIPSVWDVNGGTSSIEPFGDALCVKAGEPTQRQVAEFLNLLRMVGP